MIKRLVDIARANLNDYISKREKGEVTDFQDESIYDFDTEEEVRAPSETPDPFAQYYANLEIPPGSDREAVKSAWKRLLKKYHPDLHHADTGKRKVAEELTRRLTESYRILDKELSKRG